MSNEKIKAVHYDGGNYYDDLRIDISESHKRLVIENQKQDPKTTSKNNIQKQHLDCAPNYN